jgi:hypothetical protein
MAAKTLLLEAICPDGVGEGGLVAVQTADGTTIEVAVPAGVSPGEAFTIEYTPTSSAPWLEEILEALVAENFVRVLDGWCERECGMFLTPGEEGHTLEQTATHASYVRLYESRIESHLRRHGIPQDQFMASLLQAEASASNASKSLIASLLLVEDFEAFSKMMTQRALERDG